MATHTSLVLTYDGSFEGFLSCVFDSVYEKINPIDIISENNISQFTLLPSRYIETDMSKATRVFNSISKKICKDAEYYVTRGFLTKPDGDNCEMMLYHFLMDGYKLGASIINNYSCNSFVKVHKAVKALNGEGHLLRGFIRFVEKGNILFSKIGPKNNVLPIIAKHFANRLMEEQFIIYDENRQLAIVYKPYKYVITDVKFGEQDTGRAGPALPESNALEISSSLSHDDSDQYTELWKSFYDTIAIEGRYNPKCRMTHMPKRFWKYMTEFEGKI